MNKKLVVKDGTGEHQASYSIKYLGKKEAFKSAVQCAQQTVGGKVYLADENGNEEAQIYPAK